MTRLVDIGPVLIQARRALGMTQGELGSSLGVSQPQVARWESAAYRNVALERVSAVAAELGVTATGIPLAAEKPAIYTTALPGAEAAAIRALERTGAPAAAIVAFARTNKIERLELFGSVLRADYGPDSDVDVLVTYERGATPSLFGLADHEAELGGILRREVDLVSRTGIEASENVVRRERILSEARTLYARP
ncbi:MAG: nucleotidyltransferase domain-containing protein [Coriobacteriia bacterium]